MNIFFYFYTTTLVPKNFSKTILCSVFLRLEEVQLYLTCKKKKYQKLQSELLWKNKLFYHFHHHITRICLGRSLWHNMTNIWQIMSIVRLIRPWLGHSSESGIHVDVMSAFAPTLNQQKLKKLRLASENRMAKDKQSHGCCSRNSSVHLSWLPEMGVCGF